MKKNILKGIYAVTPNSLDEETLYKKAHKLLEQGVNILQYRDKFRSPKQKIIIAKELRNICNKFDSLLIINDDAKLAKKVGANGVHLGQKDMEIKEARKLIGKKIIGITCHNSIKLAKTAIKNKADYLAFGAFNSSKTKKVKYKASISLLKKAQKITNTPIVVIGGINFNNYKNLLLNKANFLAISGYIWKNKKLKPKNAIKKLI